MTLVPCLSHTVSRGESHGQASVITERNGESIAWKDKGNKIKLFVHCNRGDNKEVTIILSWFYCSILCLCLHKILFFRINLFLIPRKKKFTKHFFFSHLFLNLQKISIHFGTLYDAKWNVWLNGVIVRNTKCRQQ